MKLTEAQYRLIKGSLMRQRGNVSLPNILVLHAFLYIAEHDCKWRGLDQAFWLMAHPLYPDEPRSKAGVLERVFERLQQLRFFGSR